MFDRHAGGEEVRGGVYWSRKSGEFVAIPAVGGVLPGDPRDVYVRTPLPLVLLAGPLLGFAFAIFLPLSGLLVLAGLFVDRVRGGTAGARSAGPHHGGRRAVAVTVAPGVPGDSPTGEVVGQAAEIAEKRWQQPRGS